MRALEGRWEGTTDRGVPEAVVTYEVVGRGSAVVETLFPDTGFLPVTWQTLDMTAFRR